MESKKQNAVLTYGKKGGKHISHYFAVIQGPHLFGDSTPQPTQLQFCTASNTMMTMVYQQQCSDTRTTEHNSNIQLYTLCTCIIHVTLHNVHNKDTNRTHVLYFLTDCYFLYPLRLATYRTECIHQSTIQNVQERINMRTT